MSKHILVVDDQPDIRQLVQEILEEEGYSVSAAEDAESARQARQSRRPDLVLLDIWLPDVDGITLLKEWSESGADCPVIMITGHGTVETAVEATRLGAYDFLEKPLSLAKLLLTVERALEADRLQRENAGLRRHLPPITEPIGRSPAMQELRAQIKRLAQHDAWILLSGEPGSGKETFARHLHAQSTRRHGPFVDVGVGSITRENSALELFGSDDEAGRIHYGRLEQANGGILFLNEVGDMDAETQARLQSALETRSFLRVGGATPVDIDVRVVAASHRDLEQEVRAGRFREDLYYHLNVVPLRIPPLREHVEDVPDLLMYYAQYFADHEGLPYRRFTVAAQNRLRNHTWPGNVRELKNLVQRLLILGSGEEVDVDEVDKAFGPKPASPAGPQMEMPLDAPLREAREQFERIYLEHQLRLTEGNVGQLAKRVGMERTHLYRKLRSLGIDPKQAGQD